MPRLPVILVLAVALGLTSPAGGAAAQPEPDPDTRPRIYTVANQYLPGYVSVPVVSNFADTTAPLVIQEGDEVVYHYIAGAALHDVRYVGCEDPFDDDPCLFESGVVGLGQTSVVEGTTDLPLGEYDFYCSFHPGSMFGRIVVEEAL